MAKVLPLDPSLGKPKAGPFGVKRMAELNVGGWHNWRYVYIDSSESEIELRRSI
jgi:hypothetical protein